jgi:hypothetical protein
VAGVARPADPRNGGRHLIPVAGLRGGRESLGSRRQRRYLLVEIGGLLPDRIERCRIHGKRAAIRPEYLARPPQTLNSTNARKSRRNAGSKAFSCSYDGLDRRFLKTSANQMLDDGGNGLSPLCLLGLECRRMMAANVMTISWDRAT